MVLRGFHMSSLEVAKVRNLASANVDMGATEFTELVKSLQLVVCFGGMDGVVCTEILKEECCG